MRPRVLALSATPVAALFLTVLLCGCQVSIHKPAPDNILFTKSYTLVRDAPNPDARVLASIGPNTRVVASEYSRGFTRIDIDDGRLVGWVPSEILVGAPVREPKRASTPAKRRESRPAAKPETPSTPATPKKQEAPAAPAAPATMEPLQVESPQQPAGGAQTPAVATPTPQPATPTPQPATSGSGGSGGILSPAEAQAATPPPATTTPKPAPPKGKQAKPEAFDPF